MDHNMEHLGWYLARALPMSLKPLQRQLRRG